MKPQLISTIAEVQAQLPVNMTSKFDVVAPFLRGAEVKYLLPLLGNQQFDALVTAETANPESNALAETKLLCHKIIANLGYYDAVPVLSLTIGASGIQVNSNENTKQALQWQVEDLRDPLMNLGFGGIEELLQLLQADENKDTSADYRKAYPYKTQQARLIRSATEFNTLYNINGSRYTYQCLVYLMMRVEQQVVSKLIGAGFLESLKLPEVIDKQMFLLENYLKPGLALLTVAKALVERIITIENGAAIYNFKGNYNNLKQTLPATREQVVAMSDQLVTDGNQYFQDGLTYINENLADMPGYAPQAGRSRFKINNDPRKGIFAT